LTVNKIILSLVNLHSQLTRRLSSLSRRETPSPSGGARSSISSNNNPTLSLNTHQSTRLSWSSFSGSETEHEPTDNSSRLENFPPFRRSLDFDRDPSPPPRTPSPPVTYARQRLISAPASPGQSLATPANSSGTIKSATTRRRTSIELGDKNSAAVTLSGNTANLIRPGTSAADMRKDRKETKATIGRNSPINSSRRQRQPLPNEFRDSSHSSDHLVGIYTLCRSHSFY
jgi:hypothetical protein